jgi:hypothetical protein
MEYYLWLTLQTLTHRQTCPSRLALLSPVALCLAHQPPRQGAVLSFWSPPMREVAMHVALDASIEHADVRAGQISYRNMVNYTADLEKHRSLRSSLSPERAAALAEGRALRQARIRERQAEERRKDVERKAAAAMDAPATEQAANSRATLRC